MGFITAVRTCLGKFLHTSGRASRPEYWWFYLFVILAAVVAQFVDRAIFGAETPEPGHHPVTLLTSFILFFPLLAAGWRRMHDTGHSGWYVLAPQLIAMAGLAAFMVGVLGFGVTENLTGESETFRTVAGYFGTAGLIVVWLAVIAAFFTKLWFLIRPGNPETNAYGSPPA